jgi:hypothetical protein
MLQSLINKFAREPAKMVVNVAARIPSFHRNWIQTMDNLIQDIADIEDRKALLVAQRKARAVAAIEGDEAAMRQCEILDGDIAALDRGLARLNDALDGAQLHIAEENRAKAEQRAQARRIAALAKREALQAAVADALAVKEALREKLVVVRGLSDDLRRATGNSELDIALAQLGAAVPVLMRHDLDSATGFAFGQTFVTGPRADLNTYVPDTTAVEHALSVPSRSGD